MNRTTELKLSALFLAFALSACGGGGGGGDTTNTNTNGSGGSTTSGDSASGGTLTTGWNSSLRISTLRDSYYYEMYTPSVALNAHNVGFVAWHEDVDSCGDSIWVNHNESGSWGDPINIGATHGLQPYIASNNNGNAVIVWIKREWDSATCDGGFTGEEIWVSHYNTSSNNWSAPQRISVDAPNDNSIYTFSPVVTLDDAGRAMALWIQDGQSSARSLWYSRFNGTTWSAPALLSSGDRNSEEPAMKMDASGNVFAIWRQDTNPFDPNGTPVIPNVWVARYDATAATWSAPERIGSADLSGSDSAGALELAVNPSGKAVAVWQETSGSISSIAASRFVPSSGTWTTPQVLESSDEQAAWPAVAMDVNGNAQVVWEQKSDAAATDDSGYTVRFDALSGSWSAPLLFEQAVEQVDFPQVGMEDSGRALITWNQHTAGGPPIHAVHYDPANGFGSETRFAGNGVALVVSGGGTALLASDVPSYESVMFGISIHAAMFYP